MPDFSGFAVRFYDHTKKLFLFFQHLQKFPFAYRGNAQLFGFCQLGAGVLADNNQINRFAYAFGDAYAALFYLFLRLAALHGDKRARQYHLFTGKYPFGNLLLCKSNARLQ